MISMGRQEITILITVFLSILFFGIFVEYGEGTDPLTYDYEENGIQDYMNKRYSMFQDVHVMIFIGFGFLMVFLKSHSWSSVGFNLIIACWAFQLTILLTGFWHNVFGFSQEQDYQWEKIHLDIDYLILADFGAGAVLISFGAILGKANIFQLWVMATIEIFFYCFNEVILMEVFNITDIGGSIVIHTFGAYFGLSVALFYQKKAAIEDRRNLASGNYISNLVAMIGTLFLFCFWPSFNAALSNIGSQQQRTVINTYLSISTSVISSAIISKITKHGQFDIEIILNASLAGGVAIGSSADIMIKPYGSMLVGFIAGTTSALGFIYLSPFLKRAIKLHDTCGVHNLHGIPGIIGGLVSAILASKTKQNFGDNYSNIFSQTQITNSQLAGLQLAGLQLAGLAMTLAVAIISGLLAGYLTSRKWFQIPSQDRLFDDTLYWHDCQIDHHITQDIIRKYQNFSSSLTKDSDYASNNEQNKKQISQSINEEDEDQEQLEEGIHLEDRLSTLKRQTSDVRLEINEEKENQVL